MYEEISGSFEYVVLLQEGTIRGSSSFHTLANFCFNSGRNRGNNRTEPTNRTAVGSAYLDFSSDFEVPAAARVVFYDDSAEHWGSVFDPDSGSFLDGLSCNDKVAAAKQIRPIPSM